MPIDISAESNIQACQRIHRSLTDYHAFLFDVRANTAGNVAAVTFIPARVTALLADKATFDAAGLSAAEIKVIMEDIFGYANWDTHISDFNAVFTKSPGLRTAVINNIGSLVPSYNGDTLEYGAGTVQAALEAELDDILQHYA